MDSYISGSRDPSGRERTDSWTSSHRRRSQSPPARNQRDRLPDHHPTAHERDGPRRSWADSDAPPTLLARKPTATAGASGLPSRPDASTSRAASIPSASSSSSALSRADLVSRIVASAPERSLFDRIEEMRIAIAELRIELNALLKKIKQTQDHLLKAPASNQQKINSLLRDYQQSQSDIEHKIAVESDNMYRMQVEWQLALTENVIPSILSTASLPPDPKLEELRADFRADQKFIRDVDSRTRICSGQIGRFQSELSKLRADNAANSKDQSSTLDRVDRIAKDLQDTRVQLSQDLNDTRRELRRDLDKDVAQISQNHQRIRRLERDYGSIKSDATTAASRALSNASTSPRPSHASSMRATSPTRDPRSRLPPKPSADVASAASSTTASTSALPAITANAAPSQAEKQAERTSTDEPVTRSQFRKWMRDLQRDLEIQFDELKDLAVQEATAENQACMEERIQALALRWRNKFTAEFGDKEAAATDTDKQASNGSDANAAPSCPTPMDVDASATPNAAPEAAVAVQTLPVPAPVAAATSTSTSTSSQPSPAPTDSATAAPQTASTDAATTAAQSNPSNSTPVPTPVPVTASVTSPSPAAKAADAVVTDGSSMADAAKLQTNGKTAPVLQMVFSILESFKTQITTVEKKLKDELDSVRSLERNEFDALLSSPEQLKQLASALKEHGIDAPAVPTLPDAADTVSSAVVSSMRDVQQALVERIQVLEQWKVEFVVFVDRKADYLQKQLEVLDDQSSLQGALLIKLAEHANPRRPPPPTPAIAAAPTPPLPSPVARTAMPSVMASPAHPAAQAQPQPQPHPQVYRTVQQHQPAVVHPSVMTQPVQSASDVAALSAAHMSGVYTHPPHVQQRPQQHQQHQQQHQQQHPLPQRPYSHAGPGYP